MLGQDPVCPVQRHNPAGPMCRSKRIGTTGYSSKRDLLGCWRGCILASVQIGKLRPGTRSECLSVSGLESRPRDF